jgi:ketopantoate reductase
MRIAIVGAGARGRIYGVRLAEHHDVAWVVRPHRASEAGPIRIESAGLFDEARQLDAPRRVTSIPDDTELALVTLRFDTLCRPDADLARALRAPKGAEVIMLAPVFPSQRPALEALIGGRYASAMPGVSGYLDPRGVVRHWVPPLTPTTVDDGGGEAGTLRTALVTALERVGLPARLAPDVEALDAATTTSFFPVITAVAVAGSLEALARDRALTSLVLAALAECRPIAARFGRAAPGLGPAMRLVSPLTLSAAVAVLSQVAPEALHFVDHHFGPKLGEQHRLMGELILEQATAFDLDARSLRELVERVPVASAT